MALYPNGRYLTRSPGRHFGPSVGLEVYARALGDRLNRFVSDTYARTASTPDGYDVHGTVPAIKAGAMAARKPFAVVDGSANLWTHMLTNFQTCGCPFPRPAAFSPLSLF